MILPFLNRARELERLKRAIASPEGSFCCLYGRRRCGKSRLLRELLAGHAGVYYVGDRREASLQRAAVAQAVADLLPGFADVSYPDWESLLSRWWTSAPSGAVLVFDEFPAMVEASAELPSSLQKLVDAHASKPVHLVIAGSSQRLMQGLVLDQSEPLFGRAREILEIAPLDISWLPRALPTANTFEVLQAYAAWGGVPRYWELAGDYPEFWQALENLVLDPLGVLHHEPARLLADDMRDTVQASSILALVGQGCHRLSEIGGRLGKPATSLTRPVQRLVHLGLLRRETPFGHSPRSSKSTLYTLRDPFLAFWYRFVDPNRSRLGAGAIEAVLRDIRRDYLKHAGEIWERVVRAATPRLDIARTAWDSASRWWGAGLDRQPLEVDVVAESIDRKSLLVGEVKLQAAEGNLARLTAELDHHAVQLPFVKDYACIVKRIFVGSLTGNAPPPEHVVTAADLLAACEQNVPESSHASQR